MRFFVHNIKYYQDKVQEHFHLFWLVEHTGSPSHWKMEE